MRQLEKVLKLRKEEAIEKCLNPEQHHSEFLSLLKYGEICEDWAKVRRIWIELEELEKKYLGVSK